MAHRTLAELKDLATRTKDRPTHQEWSDIFDTMHTGVVSVGAFGAKGDGVTDDTLAIQAAVDEAGSFGVVLFPPNSTFLVNKRILASGYAGIAFYSSGKGSILKMADGANISALLEINDCDFADIYGLRFDGNNTNQTSGNRHAIQIEDTVRLTAERLYISDFGGTALRLNGTTTSHANQFTNIKIRDCGTGLYLVSNAFDTQVANMWIGQSSADGIRIDSGSSSNVLTNVHSWGNTGDALRIRSDQNRIMGGYYEQSAQGIDLFGSEKNRIIGCWIRQNTGQGVYAEDAVNCSVTDCIVDDNSGDGVDLNNSVGCIVTGNTVVNNTGTGINIRGTANRNIVRDNGVEDDQGGSQTQTNGIVLAGTADDNSVTNNMLLSQPTNRLVNSSSGNQNIVKDNVTSTGIWAFTDQDATPSVLQADVFKTANTIATTITNFDDGYEGKIIKVLIQDTNTTIDFTASNLKGNAGVNWSPTTDDHMTCVFDGTDWYCNISDNTA